MFDSHLVTSKFNKQRVITDILDKGEYTWIPGKALLLAIMKESVKKTKLSRPIYIFVSLLQTFLPLILHYGFGVQIFSHYLNLISFGCSVIPLGMLYWANMILIGYATQVMVIKKETLETILGMLDLNVRSNDESDRLFPHLKVYDANNLQQFINMTRIVQRIMGLQQKRGIGFCTAIVCVYSIQFGFICIKTILFGTYFFEVATIQFLVYCIFDFIVFIGLFLETLAYASLANNVDSQISRRLHCIKRDINEALINNKSTRILIKKNKKLPYYKRIDVLTPVEAEPDLQLDHDGGLWFSLITQTTVSDLADYKPVPENFEDQIESIKLQIDNCLDTMEFKLHNEQISMFGMRITASLILSIVSTIGSLFVMMFTS